MPVYRHTQIGHVILVGLLVPCPFIIWAFHDLGGLFLLPAMLIACAALFGTLTIEIRNGLLKWSFGPGLIRKSVALEQIDCVELWRMRGFLGGWGIHWFPGRGWLYNVSGLRGVAVTLKTGKRFVLGTDQPEQLLSAIESAIAGNVRP